MRNLPARTNVTDEAPPPVTKEELQDEWDQQLEQIKQRAKSQLVEIQQQIQRAAGRLNDDDLPGKEMRDVAMQLQRLRVAALLQREIILDTADPTTYRELQLLNKMNTAGELGEDPAAEIELAERQERVREAGIDPESASSMVRVFNALREAMDGERARVRRAALESDESRDS